jgi:CRISPR/Cas system CMR-associated protein Cmr5 small subunit
MKISLILSLLALSFTSAFARIGETAEQCTARYGKETLGENSEDTKYFRKNGIELTVDFRDGKACEIDYSAEAKWGNLLGKLTDETIRELLKLYEEGQKWEEIEEKNPTDVLFEKNFKRSDGKLLARWDYSSNHLRITTTEEKNLREKEEIAKKAAEKAAIKSDAAEKTKGL